MMEKYRNLNWSKMAKRFFDIIISAPLLLFFLPILSVVWVLGFFYLGRPVFFQQERPGLGGKAFRILKFRTMRQGLDAQGQPLPDAQRMTAYGRILRVSSLDELPELWNVLVGEMSLVGPRPLLMEYLPLYSKVEARRHEVRPGITGWSQVKGRNALDWDQRLKLDVWYVDNRSFALDIKILFLTFFTVLKGSGVSQKGHVTMEKFKGHSS